MTHKSIEEVLKDFDQKFNKIVHMHRGECVITDSTGTEFQAHTDENGKVTEVGGLESVKDFIRATFTTILAECEAKVREEERARIVEWAKGHRLTGLLDGSSFNNYASAAFNNALDDLITHLTPQSEDNK